MANKDVIAPPIVIGDYFTAEHHSNSSPLFDQEFISMNSKQDHHHEETLCVDDYSINLDNTGIIDALQITIADDDSPPGSSGLSIENLVRIAASKFIRSHSDDSSFHHFTPLSRSESEGVDLTQILLEAAERVGNGQLDGAETFLQQCDLLSSASGTPIQRLVYYYSRALRVRIDREIGGNESKEQSSFDLYKLVMTPSFRFVEFHKKVPFAQVAQFAGIQSIVEHVERSKKIHVIDFGIRNGHQWTILMQALASRKRRRVSHLKITAVATSGKHLVEQTGQRLISFAQGMNLSCSFHVVMVQDLTELTRDHFEIEPEEVVAVLAEYIVNTLTKPVERLDTIIRAIRSLYPTVMVVTEMEVNMNSPVFVNRFVESLFFSSVYFDCFEDCMDRHDASRIYGESMLFGEGSKMVVGIEGEERFIRSMKADVWRVYFRRMGMVEAILSESSLYQAELVAKKVASWRACTVGINEKSLIIGWKGTPILSVTAWKFS
ncbi:DELLA protein RGL2 [Linum perenne]